MLKEILKRANDEEEETAKQGDCTQIQPDEDKSMPEAKKAKVGQDEAEPASKDVGNEMEEETLEPAEMQSTSKASAEATIAGDAEMQSISKASADATIAEDEELLEFTDDEETWAPKPVVKTELEEEKLQTKSLQRCSAMKMTVCQVLQVWQVFQRNCQRTRSWQRTAKIPL